MKKNAVALYINYAGMQLPIIKNLAGEDCTPLKPIVDLLGLRWENQREKVTKSQFLRKFLGVCIPPRGGAHPHRKEENCILLSRVAAFIMSINPAQVRSQGNESAADFLEQKLEEWADALHDYEELGVAFNMNHSKNLDITGRQYMRVASMLNIKAKLQNPNERRLVDNMIVQAAGELGIQYQPDLLDQQAQREILPRSAG